MKTKSTQLIFIAIILLSTINCSIEGLNQTHLLPLCCKGSDSNEVVEGEIEVEDETSEEESIPPYTQEEIQEIRQNMQGTYQGISTNNILVTIRIGENDVPSLDNINPGDSLGFSIGRLREYFRDDSDYIYLVDFSIRSRTEIIGLRSISENSSVKYLMKIGGENYYIPYISGYGF